MAGSGCVTQWNCHKRLLTPRGLKQVIRTAPHPCPPKSSLASPSFHTGTAQKASLNLQSSPSSSHQVVQLKFQPTHPYLDRPRS